MFGVETDKIYIYPLGGIARFNMPLNIEIYKEFVILIMGPLFQNIAFIILYNIFTDKSLVITYHTGILLFNLLPIYPLDGGKLVNLILNKLLPYKMSYKVIIIISYITTVIILFYNNKLSINMIITYVLLIFLIRREELHINLMYNKFLLERYLNRYHFKHSKIINNINNFYRTKNNIIKEQKQYYNERDYLTIKYNKF